jgi:hypothetical protein
MEILLKWPKILPNNNINQGKTCVISINEGEGNHVIKTECTAIEKDLDKLIALLPKSHHDKLDLINDVKGHEPIAIHEQGNMVYMMPKNSSCWRGSMQVRLSRTRL